MRAKEDKVLDYEFCVGYSLEHDYHNIIRAYYFMFDKVC